MIRNYAVRSKRLPSVILPTHRDPKLTIWPGQADGKFTQKSQMTIDALSNTSYFHPASHTSCRHAKQVPIHKEENDKEKNVAQECAYILCLYLRRALPCDMLCKHVGKQHIFFLKSLSPRKPKQTKTGKMKRCRETWGDLCKELVTMLFPLYFKLAVFVLDLRLVCP